MDILLIIIGFGLIIGGANYLTDGAVSLAKRLKLPEFIIGLTIVAVGTSMPEMVVSVISSIKGNGTLAIGNVVGSNIFNILVILGICTLFAPLALTKGNIKRDIPQAIIVSLMLLLISLTGVINRVAGIAMLLIYAIMIGYSIVKGRKEQSETAEELESVKPKSIALTAIMIVGGLSAIIYGGDMLLKSAVNLAHTYNIPDNIIAITLLAGGTSIPELAASLVSLIKGRSDIALGNVVGSNIANILLILGVSATITPLSLGDITMIDLSVMLGSTIFLLVAAYTFKRNMIDRAEGAIMLIAYALYIAMLITQ